MNRYEVIGNVGKQPVITTTGGGLTIASLSIATSEYAGKDDQGKTKYATEWHSIKVFGGPAEFIKNNVNVGDKCMASGRHIVETWDKKDGTGKGYAAVLQVGKMGSFELLSKAGAKASAAAAGADDDSGEIPF